MKKFLVLLVYITISVCGFSQGDLLNPYITQPRPEFAGTLINETFSSLSNWTNIGGGTSSASGDLSMSSGATDYSRYIYYSPGGSENYAWAGNKWKDSVVFRLSTGEALAFGTVNRQTNGSAEKRAVRVLVNRASNTINLVSFNGGSSTTQHSLSITAPANTDDLIIVFERRHFQYMVNFYNSTTGENRSLSWEATAGTANNTGHISVFN
jgi:hypothetical protein